MYVSLERCFLSLFLQKPDEKPGNTRLRNTFSWRVLVFLIDRRPLSLWSVQLPCYCLLLLKVRVGFRLIQKFDIAEKCKNTRLQILYLKGLYFERWVQKAWICSALVLSRLKRLIEFAVVVRTTESPRWRNATCSLGWLIPLIAPFFCHLVFVFCLHDKKRNIDLPEKMPYFNQITLINL